MPAGRIGSRRLSGGETMTCRYLLIATGMLVLAMPLQAAVGAAELDGLRAEIRALAERVSALEAENAALRETGPSDRAPRDSAARWTDTVALTGDFRYRYETIDRAGRSERRRHRIRARVALLAKPTDALEAGLGLASGGDHPLSTNQSLGQGGTSKALSLDLAWFNWALSDNLTLQAGKYKNIWYRPGESILLWDSDYNQEGIALLYRQGPFFATLGGIWLESDTRGDQDSYSWGGQLGYSTGLGQARLTAGASYFAFDSAGLAPIYNGELFGNSMAEDGSYLYDYQQFEIFGDLSMNLGSLPLSLYADYVVNSDASDNNRGYAFGVKLGKARLPGSWQLAYGWQKLAADAALGLVTDADFGGTDVEGHVVRAAYALDEQFSLGLAWFDKERGADAGTAQDYRRLQLDLSLRY